MNASQRGSAEPGPVGAPPRRTWGFAEVGLVLVATLGAWTMIAIPALAIGDSTITAKVTGNTVSLLLTALVFVGVPILVLRMMAVSVGSRELGLRLPRRPWMAVGAVVLGYLVFALLAQGLGALIGVGDTQDDVPQKLGADSTILAGIVLGLCTSVLAPIGEETFLRGVIYPGLRDGLGRFAPRVVAIGVAALINGALFGVLHGATDPIFIPILALFGVVLCLAYQLTGSLYVPIVIHATNNAIAMAVSLDWPVGRGIAVWLGAMVLIALFAAVVRRLTPVRPATA